MNKKIKEIKKHIQENRDAINAALSGSNTIKRINDLNWLRHEIAFVEPIILFHSPEKSQKDFLDNTNMRNIGDTYDYIVCEYDIKQPLTTNFIRDIHAKLYKNTNLQGASYRNCGGMLNIVVNQPDGGNTLLHLSQPRSYEIESQLGNILYHANNQSTPYFTRAINAHYEIIMLQPFPDGNKRIARVVMNTILLAGGYTPIAFNHKTDHNEYIDAIEQRANGNNPAYNEYMYKCTLRTQRQLLKHIHKSKIK